MTRSRSRCPTGKKEWRVVGVVEDSPLIFSPVLTTTQTLLASGFPDQDNYVVVFAEPGARACRTGWTRS